MAWTIQKKAKDLYGVKKPEWFSIDFESIALSYVTFCYGL